LKFSYIASGILTFILLAVFLIDTNKDTHDPLLIEGQVMGTSYKIILYGDNISTSKETIHSIFEEVNQEMSTYIKDSTITKLNTFKLFEWLTVSDDFMEVLEFALDLCVHTHGVYDVSVGKLVNINGFGPKTEHNLINKDKKEILDQIGCDSIETKKSSVRRLRNVHLDFSSIAKGYAIDLVHKALLSDISIKSHYVELGGEIRTSLMKLKDTPWVVGIENPQNPNKAVLELRSNLLQEFSIATSGDYRNFRVDDGEAFSHTINTKTGKPKRFSKSSITVLSETAMKADALATALNAMKLEKAIHYSNENDINAVFLTNQNGKVHLIFSKSMAKIVK